MSALKDLTVGTETPNKLGGSRGIVVIPGKRSQQPRNLLPHYLQEGLTLPTFSGLRRGPSPQQHLRERRSVLLRRLANLRRGEDVRRVHRTLAGDG
uniref:Uncharacterized protein n=1 Tax=Steinernema glaseri TaxID=37863 RepID=A0A1I8ADB0_9BILA